MGDQEQVRKIKCPHCGWVRSVPVTAIEDVSMATVVSGLSERMKAAVEKIRATLADAQLDEANTWVDMPQCPNCNNVYQYNVRSGATRA